MIPPEFDNAIAYARERMARELAPELVYHNLAHTFNEVMPAARYLALTNGLDDFEVQLVAIGAAFHDIGWVIQGPEHETIGAEIACDTLPSFGFKPSNIDVVCGMILATRLPCFPTNLLEEIVVDADLDVLGREDFWQRNTDLRAELAAGGTIMTDEKWYRQQLSFLQSHRYYTKPAQQLRNVRKSLNIIEIKERLQQTITVDQSV